MPVVLFHNGFEVQVGEYAPLLRHIASWGFVVVAPQSNDSLFNPSAWPTVNMSMAILDWIQTKLQGLTLVQLQTAVDVRSGVTIAGHSRGGKVATAVAVNVTQTLKPGVVRAVVLLDPVDGANPPVFGPIQTEPKLLCVGDDKAACPFTLAQPAPVLLVGTGFGAVHRCPSGDIATRPPCSCPLWGACGAACAPPPFAYEDFFEQLTQANISLFTTPAFGHMDLLQDQPLVSKVCLHCPFPEQRQLFRSFLGGAAVAFLHATLDRVPDEGLVAAWLALHKPCGACPAHGNISITYEAKPAPPSPGVRLASPLRMGDAHTDQVMGMQHAVL